MVKKKKKKKEEKVLVRIDVGGRVRNDPVEFSNFVAYDGFLQQSVLNNVYATKGFLFLLF
jgi:hypothetical protein